LPTQLADQSSSFGADTFDRCVEVVDIIERHLSGDERGDIDVVLQPHLPNLLADVPRQDAIAEP